MTDCNDSRLIMFHKQGTSARIRFLLLDGRSVCGFTPLSKMAELLGDDALPDKVMLHPGALVHAAETRLDLPAGSLDAMGDFRRGVDVAGGPVTVFLARFTTQDPPFASAEAIGARFIELPESRMLPPIELQLLRQVYEYLMGG